LHSYHTSFFLSSTIPPRPHSTTLFPYTTLFRSPQECKQRLILPLRETISGMTLRHDLQPSHAAISGMKQSAVCCEVVLLDKTDRSEEHTSELQSRENIVCRLLLEKKKMS